MNAQTTRPRPARFDTVVIGGGVVGASIAQHLSRRGVSVAVLDQASGVGGGCSYANAAIVAPHHVVPLATPALLREAPRQMVRRPPAVRVQADPSLVPWLGALSASASPRRSRVATERLQRLAVESTELHRELAAQGLNPTLRKTGAVDVYLRKPRREPSGFVPFVDLLRLEPTLATGAGGTHDGEEWTLESRSFVTAMLEDAARHGADVRYGTTVERLLMEHGRIVGVATPSRTIRADHVVLAAGLGAAPLAGRVGVSLPLRGGRGYVVDLAIDSGGPRLPVRIKDYRVVVTPLADRVRVAGAIEFGDESRPMDEQRAEALRRVAGSVLPALSDALVIDRWAGERPCTPDGVPVIGASKAVENLLVATGHGMWGMILAPVTGRLIADAVLGMPEPAPWLAPDRFAHGMRRALATR
ncbi:NAD(P)/FAD-dependent oxidoreductase [Aeromicrobium phragmitis]|nr:FAD-dependent oxidoreductase [Aeromicrobium phragmitis]